MIMIVNNFAPLIFRILINLAVFGVVHASHGPPYRQLAFAHTTSSLNFRTQRAIHATGSSNRRVVFGLHMEDKEHNSVDEFEEWYKSTKEGSPKVGRTLSARLPLHVPGDQLSLGPGMEIFVLGSTPPTPGGPIWESIEGTCGGGRVSVKVISLRGLGGDWGALDAMQYSGKAQKAAMGRSPGILPWLGDFEVDVEDDRIYYGVSEAVQGATSIANVISSGWRPTEQDVMDIGEALLKVLESLESLRPPLVHGDVGPRSVLIAPAKAGSEVERPEGGGGEGSAAGSWRVWLVDFAGLDRQGVGEGDVFGVGEVMLFLLSGGKGVDDFEWGKDGTSSFPRNVVASKGLKSLVATFLDRGVHARVPSAAQALAALQAVRFGEERNAALLPWNVASGSQTPRDGLPHSKPEGTRIVLLRSGKRLDITIPKAGVTPETVSSGIFSATWTAGIAFWTATAITGGAPLVFTAFSIPFWLAGGGLAKRTVLGAAASESFVIDGDLYSLRRIALGREIGGGTGDRGDLVDCSVVTTGFVNSRPTRSIRIKSKREVHDLGLTLSEAELQWLCCEVRSFLGLPLKEFPLPPLQLVAGDDRF